MATSNDELLEMTQELFHGTTAVSDGSDRNEPVETYPEVTEKKIAWVKVRCPCCGHGFNVDIKLTSV